MSHSSIVKVQRCIPSPRSTQARKNSRLMMQSSTVTLRERQEGRGQGSRSSSNNRRRRGRSRAPSDDGAASQHHRRRRSKMMSSSQKKKVTRRRNTIRTFVRVRPLLNEQKSVAITVDGRGTVAHYFLGGVIHLLFLTFRWSQCVWRSLLIHGKCCVWIGSRCII